jgi:Na+-translocating ferredoxin:NAD+ oxidoreductase subunit B
MDIYESLREVLDTHPSTAPKARAIDEILKILFTPQEAAIASVMSYRVKKVSDLAAKAGLSETETMSHLEALANKGIIMARRKDGEMHYGLVPLIPGVFEFPFMKDEGTAEQKRLGALWEEYHRKALGNAFAGNPTPLMRVVAVEESITAKDRIHPYEEVKTFIDDATYLALAKCACRISVAGCEKPKEVCLIFGNAAEFLVERGFARRISKDDGLAVLNRAEKAGLVHTSNNSADRANLICNCCPCCCTVLRGKTQLNHPHAFEPSRFEAKVNSDECSGCSICANERCPVKAISMNNEVAMVNKDQCIGCGLCVTSCPTGAMALEERAQIPSTPATLMEMGMKVVEEKGRLEAFMKLMSE